MKLVPHRLRFVSDILHNVAMLPCMPLPIARIIGKAASRFYYQLAK